MQMAKCNQGQEESDKSNLCTGGILSSATIRRLVLHSGDKDYNEMHSAFLRRNWEKIGDRLIIDPYDQLNLTPFSYDLSIGHDLVSVRPKERKLETFPYEIDPGETVIILTREFIALPPAYAATVWPRFTMVREGLLQNMVKIDPTWYGRLAVGVCNLSPRTHTLHSGEPFGTLIMYGLSEPSDMNLWKLEEIEPVSVNITGVAGRDRIVEGLQKFGKYACINGDNLQVRALKQADYQKLLALDNGQVWKDKVEEVREKWLKQINNGAYSIGMPGLGMMDLTSLAKGEACGIGPDIEKVIKEGVAATQLEDAAMLFGPPFHLVYGLPNMIKKEVANTVLAEIQSSVAATVYPNVVTLVLRLIGSFSLVVGLIALMIKLVMTNDLESSKLYFWGVAGFGLAVILLLIFFDNILRGTSLKSKKKRKQTEDD